MNTWFSTIQPIETNTNTSKHIHKPPQSNQQQIHRTLHREQIAPLIRVAARPNQRPNSRNTPIRNMNFRINFLPKSYPGNNWTSTCNCSRICAKWKCNVCLQQNASASGDQPSMGILHAVFIISYHIRSLWILLWYVYVYCDCWMQIRGSAETRLPLRLRMGVVCLWLVVRRSGCGLMDIYLI